MSETPIADSVEADQTAVDAEVAEDSTEDTAEEAQADDAE